MVYHDFLFFRRNAVKKISAQEFINTNPQTTRQSKLMPFKDDILLLKNKGYTGKQILEFLRLNDIIISMNALNVFIRKNINESVQINNEPQKPLQTKEKIIKNQSKLHQNNEKPSLTIDDPHPINTGFKKFNTREQRDIDDLI